MKAKVVLMSLAAALLLWFGLAYTGMLDRGTFELLQSESVRPDLVAMLAKRSDKTALSGNTIFVLIGDHVDSAGELRRALYSSRPVFVAGRDGLILRWKNSHELQIECKGCGITDDRIQKQSRIYKDISIQYIGFPLAPAASHGGA